MRKIHTDKNKKRFSLRRFDHAKAYNLKGLNLKKLEVKAKIIVSWVVLTLAGMLGFGVTIWLAITLWQLNPAAPGVVAFVFGGIFLIYRATTFLNRLYMEILEAQDMEK